MYDRRDASNMIRLLGYGLSLRSWLTEPAPNMTARPKTTPALRFADLRGAGTFSLWPLLERSRVTLTYNGRGALYSLCSAIGGTARDVILLPAFTCPSVVDPVIKTGFHPRYYSVNADLSLDVTDLLSKLDSRVAAVIVINYFGFPTDLSELSLPCREMGTLLIEDCAHSFVDANPIRLSGYRADAAVFSFKKLLPSHVGGGIRLNLNGLEIAPPRARPPLRDSLINCKQLFEEAVDNLADGHIRRLYHRLESLRVRIKSRGFGAALSADISPIRTFEYPFEVSLARAGMPWYARKIVASSDVHRIVSKRRANYSTLLEGLGDIDGFAPVYKSLPSSVCPWGLPILVHNRSSIDRRLQALGVPLFSFGETMHPSVAQGSAGNKAMFDAAHFLSTTLLVIAVHQGLPSEAFSKYCDIIHSQFST